MHGLYEMNRPTNHSLVEIDLDNERGMLSSVPEKVGPRFETPAGGVLAAIRASGSMNFRSNGVFASVLLAPIPDMESAFASDRVQRFDAPVGTLVINPSNVDRMLRWSAPKQNAAIAIGRSTYAELAAAELDGKDWELRPPKFGHVDLKALRIATAMAEEIRSPAINTLYFDSLITVFGVHLIRTYSADMPMRATKGRRLAGATSKRVLEYLNEHSAEKIAIRDLAAVSHMSASHFIRAFTLTYGMPPHKFLSYVRLEKAEKLLVETSLSIEAVASLTGFSSQSHLTHAMMRLKHTTPGKIRYRR